MEKFCKTLDTNYIKKLSKEKKNMIKYVFDTSINLKDVPDDKKNIYYILHTFFYPVKLTKRQLHGLNINNFCLFFSSFILPNITINKLFFTVYNAIIIKGLHPDLRNLNNTFLVLINLRQKNFRIDSLLLYLYHI